jgi:hypothetical protein
MIAPILDRPRVRNGRNLRHRGNRRIEITSLIPDKRDAANIFSRFGADMNDRSLANPFFIVDFDRIVTYRDNQISLIGETFDVGSPRPADNARPTGMAFW